MIGDGGVAPKDATRSCAKQQGQFLKTDALVDMCENRSRRKLSSSERNRSAGKRHVFGDKRAADAHGSVCFSPVDGAPASADSMPSCNYCRYNDGTCRGLCSDIIRLVPDERYGKNRKEYTNEQDLEGHTAKPAIPPSRDYSRLLEVPHLYTKRQLAALRLVHSGRTRHEVCEELGVSSSSVSQLLKGALRRYEAHDVRLRARVALEVKRLMAREPSDNDE